MAQSTSTRSEEDARLVKSPDALPPWRHISAYLVNSAGAQSMAVDGSGGSPQVFSYSPPENYDFVAVRIIIYLQTSSAMSVDVFGNLAAALGQGVEFKVNGTLITTWKDNIDICAEMFDHQALVSISDIAADTTLVGRWTFSRDTNGMGLATPNGTSFEVVINDDLSTLTDFRMKLKGKLVATGQ